MGIQDEPANQSSLNTAANGTNPCGPPERAMCFHGWLCEQGLGGWGAGGWELETGAPPHPPSARLCLSDSLLCFLPPRCHFLSFSCPVGAAPPRWALLGNGTGGRRDSWGRSHTFLPFSGVSFCVLLCQTENTSEATWRWPLPPPSLQLAQQDPPGSPFRPQEVYTPGPRLLSLTEYKRRLRAAPISAWKTLTPVVEGRNCPAFYWESRGWWGREGGGRAVWTGGAGGHLETHGPCATGAPSHGKRRRVTRANLRRPRLTQLQCGPWHRDVYRPMVSVHRRENWIPTCCMTSLTN